MNFLSHFYFDRNTEDHNLVLGTVLPDLLKNANSSWKVHPERNEASYDSLSLINLYTGWKRHVWVDKYFHSSSFFKEYSRKIRMDIFPLLASSPVKPFFVAHIALELLLDSFLLKNDLISASNLYQHLEKADRKILSNFLEINNIDDPEHFIRFLNKFIGLNYMDSYREPRQIVNALNGICSRIWAKPFDDVQKNLLTNVIINYMSNLQDEFMVVFDEIDRKLSR